MTATQYALWMIYKLSVFFMIGYAFGRRGSDDAKKMGEERFIRSGVIAALIHVVNTVMAAVILFTSFLRFINRLL